MRRQRRHIREVAVLVGVIQAVSDDELVGNVETDVLDIQRAGHGLRLAEHRHDLDGVGVAAAQVLHQVAQRQAGVDDVLDDEDVAALDVLGEVLEDAHHAAGLRTGTVGRHGHPVHGHVGLHRAAQVRHGHDSTVEHTNHEDFPPRIVGVDLGSDLADTRGHLLIGVQNAVEIFGNVRSSHGSSLPIPDLPQALGEV